MGKGIRLQQWLIQPVMKLFISVLDSVSPLLMRVIRCFTLVYVLYRNIQYRLPEPRPNNLQGTCRREPSISRTFENNTINNTLCSWQTLIADPNKAACVFGKVWHWVAGGGSPSPCSNHRICPISVAVKDLSSDNRVNNNIIVCILVWWCPSAQSIYSTASLWIYIWRIQLIVLSMRVFFF